MRSTDLVDDRRGGLPTLFDEDGDVLVGPVDDVVDEIHGGAVGIDGLSTKSLKTFFIRRWRRNSRFSQCFPDPANSL